MFKTTLFVLALNITALQAEYCSVSLLEPYRQFLVSGTYDHADWSDFKTPPKSRYDTFRKSFELFEENQGKVIVELGTSRSFVHGGLLGCNSDDTRFWTPNEPQNWDWGAGFFTRMVSASLCYLNPQIHTVDLISSHINRCKWMTKEYSNLITYHVASSLDYLAQCQFSEGIDLLYLDTGDMTPIEPTALLQLAEAKIIVKRNLIASKGIILIDDVRNQTPKKFGDTTGLGKSKYALPYLLENGFELVMDEYQVLLQKK